MYFISKKTLNYLKEDLFLDVEICGNFFITENNEFKIREATKGTKEIYRGVCKQPKYDSFIFHTHAMDMKPYPSTEDVLKILKEKNKIIKSSFVFTKWGIYEISCGKHVKEKDQSTVKEIIEYYIEKIYHNTNKGKDYDYYKIKEILKKCTIKLNHFGLKIKFTPWKQVEYPFVV